jgi:hypothetical protein
VNTGIASVTNSNEMPLLTRLEAIETERVTLPETGLLGVRASIKREDIQVNADAGSFPNVICRPLLFHI